MLRTLTLLAGGLTACLSYGQALNNVVFSPNVIDACDQVNMTVVGTYPATNYVASSFAFNINGSVMTLTYRAEPDGFGGPTITPFSEPLPTVGPWPEGTFQFVANFELIENNGNDTILVDTYNTTVNVLPPPTYDPGTDAVLDTCNVGAPFPLISLLGGSPDAGGTWLDPFGFPHSPSFVPGDDVPGIYIYQFDVLPPCVDTSSQVLITYLPNGNPGQDTQVSICTTDDPVALFPLIPGNPQLGGTWSGPGGSTFNGTYDPAVNNTGNYNYTVQGIPPCGNPSATVQVIELNLPNAGQGGSALICEDDTSEVLFDYLTGAPNNGTWYDPLGFLFGFADTALFNALIHFPGDYAYVVTANPCPADTAFVTVTIDPLPCGIGIEEADPNVAGFVLMPNPTDGRLTYDVKLLGRDPAARIEVVDPRGGIVRQVGLSGNPAERGQVDLTELARGTYLVRLLTSTGATVQRVVLH